MENESFREDAPVNRSIQIDDETEELMYDILRKNFEEQCKRNEKEGNFLEADKIYQRILELKKQVQKRKREIIAQRQQAEVVEIEKAYEDEIQAHNSAWQEKMNQFRQSCKDAEDQVIKKQSNEFETTKKSLEDSIPIIPKHSPEILNLKRIQDTLVRNKEYKEAHFVQQQIIELEEKSKLSWGLDRESKIQQSLNFLLKKQENEISSFKQKVLAGAEELKKMKVIEHENIIKKYQNLRKEIVTTHNLEKNRFEGKHTTGCGTFKTDPNQSSRAIFNLKTPMTSRPGTAVGDRSLNAAHSMKNLKSGLDS
jgi:hypothetical protein